MANEVVKQEEKKELTYQDKVKLAVNFIDKAKESWKEVLPKICTPERFAMVALSCLKGNRKLLDAIATKEGQISLVQALKTCAELGIEPDNRRAYLIPYKDEVNLIIDYKGIVELAMRSNFVSNIYADKVCDNDEFEYNIGQIETHKINFREPRGEPYAYYATVTFKDGSKRYEVMSKAEIDEIKKRSSAWKNFERKGIMCPWNTDYDEMAKKTVFKRLAKWIPQSPELRQAIAYDDEDYRKNPLDVSVFDDSGDKYDAIPLDDEKEDVKEGAVE
ncbi:MAG: recombinase RecT [Methanobrevibacter sp.]|nr:recombinase RecT [Methanobrevibacter sp.]